MCGIYGVIATPGNQVDIGTIRALTWANRERGTDSVGFFDSSGKMIKCAEDPKEAIAQPNFTKWFKASKKRAWFLAGHTRFATRGKVNHKNSHPFRYGKIVGSHNGICDAPAKFNVDSEYLFWSLNKHKGDYNAALGNISGYWGLSWFDGAHFWLMKHNAELHLAEVDGIYYYSSDGDHLAACVGDAGIAIQDGEVWRFGRDGSVECSSDKDSTIAAFESTVRYSYSKYSGRKYKDVNWNDYTDYSTNRDYDDDWAKSWIEYCDEDGSEAAKTIHGLSDEEWDEYQRYSG